MINKKNDEIIDTNYINAFDMLMKSNKNLNYMRMLKMLDFVI